MTEKVGTRHLCRKAIVYVRQSSAHQVQHHGQVGPWVAQAENGQDRRDNNRITAFQQCLGGGQAHLLDMRID